MSARSFRHSPFLKDRTIYRSVFDDNIKAEKYFRIITGVETPAFITMPWNGNVMKARISIRV
ncbi:MAG: hypothetical protein HC887_07460 [Desulfobacteraceae bacterium]|nr:hypothetical protein [Desulfobacteraceae bacterium]